MHPLSSRFPVIVLVIGFQMLGVDAERIMAPMTNDRVRPDRRLVHHAEDEAVASAENLSKDRGVAQIDGPPRLVMSNGLTGHSLS